MMKWMSAIAMFSTLAWGEGTIWLSWKQALMLSEKSHKPIMIEAMKDGCKYCVKMDNEVFSDKVFAEYLHSKVIPVKINLSKEKMPIDEEPMMTPTFYFVDSSKNVIKEIPGSWNQDDFKSILEKIK